MTEPGPENILTQNAINNRATFIPTVLSIGNNGVLRLPNGALLDFSNITVTLPSGASFNPDSLPSEDFILNSAASSVGFTNPNTCALTSYRNFVAASDSGTINGTGRCNSILASTGCSLTTTSSYTQVNSSSTSVIDSSTCTAVDSSSGANLAANSECSVRSSILPAITSSVTSSLGSTNSCSITGSVNSEIVGSTSCTITGATSASISTSTSCTIAPSTFCSVKNSFNSNIQNLTTAHLNKNSDVQNCTTGNIMALGTSICQYCSVRNSYGGSNITAPATACLVDGTNITNMAGTTCCASIASTSASIDNCSNSLVCGSSPQCLGYSDSWVFGPTSATANNQFSIGGNLVVTGSITSGSGGTSYKASDIITQSGGTYTVGQTLDIMTFTGATLPSISFPALSTFCSTWANGTARTFTFISGTWQTLTINAPAGTAGSVWNSHSTGSWTTVNTNSEISINIVKSSTGVLSAVLAAPYRSQVQLTSSQLNWVGTGSALANASLLPTSTSKANHLTLGAVAEANYDGHSQIHSGGLYNLTLPVSGLIINYQCYIARLFATIQVTANTTGATGNYQLRADIRNVANTSLAYTEEMGSNAAGSRTINLVVQIPPTLANLGDSYYLYISQDSTNMFATTSNIQVIAITAEIWV